MQALELMGRVKLGVDKLKGAFQAQRGELERQMAEASEEQVRAGALVHTIPSSCSHLTDADQ